TVVVAQVAVAGAGPEIDPGADVGVAQEAVVDLVAGPLHDARLDLSPDPAFRAERRSRPDPGAVYLRSSAEDTRSFQAREGGHHHPRPDDHRTPCRVRHDVGVDARRWIDD